MGRRRRPGFNNAKMLSSRVEQYDYDQFERILKKRDGKSLQEVVNLFVTEYVSGNIYVSGSGFGVKDV